MAKKAKKIRRHVGRGIAHVKATFNNTLVSITDAQGHVIGWSSAGRVGFKGSRKSTAYAAQQVAQDAEGGAAREPEHENRARRVMFPEQRGSGDHVPSEAGEEAALVVGGVDRPGHPEFGGVIGFPDLQRLITGVNGLRAAHDGCSVNGYSLEGKVFRD